MTMWTLETGLEVVRSVEQVVKDLNAHCALGGSVLMKGESQKDLDIFIYPHDNHGYDRGKILAALTKLGYPVQEQAEHKDEYAKTVHKHIGDRRIDFFFI
jgi:hypothetical protein